MGKEKGVKLHGMWASSFCMRVELALKLKGIPYEYVEEDLSNKSHLLLRYNPIHKKVPVLVHDGRPISESLLILEYIDDTWKDSPSLMPLDPYMRARVRFWANFYDQKLVENCRVIWKCKGEEQTQAIKDFIQNLRVLEEGIQKDFSGEKPFFNGKCPGYLDVALGAVWCWNSVLEEITGVKLIDSEKNPFMSAWIDAFCNLGIVKDTLPSLDELVVLATDLRNLALESSVA
ncbi:glutathione transferase GST 23-like [Magnolia sinica]|uniref:glutathione transferase GST 23-like n=1 Tax=Magnolia sinica TaxID=86752 RepID=UPI002657BA45|nr:glutathione transferase GST 23-like [Magnolia sinica]